MTGVGRQVRVRGGAGGGGARRRCGRGARGAGAAAAPALPAGRAGGAAGRSRGLLRGECGRRTEAKRNFYEDNVSYSRGSI